MPIYAYKCDSCGYAKDVLQKMSDAVLTDCPQCCAPAFKKQLTAAGFQLKGSGWYVTDFRGGIPAGEPAKDGDKPAKAADAPTPANSSAAAPGNSAAFSNAPAVSVPATAPASSGASIPAAPKGSV